MVVCQHWCVHKWDKADSWNVHLKSEIIDRDKNFFLKKCYGEQTLRTKRASVAPAITTGIIVKFLKPKIVDVKTLSQNKSKM